MQEISKERKAEWEKRRKARECALNKIGIIETTRPNGTLRIQYNYEDCPSMTEQHTSHSTDLNWLMEKYKPDELTAYIAARTQHRVEVLGHDFSMEPNLQEAKNIILDMEKAFDDLPDEIRKHFKNHIDFMKFIDNPRNQDRMIELGILKKKEVEDLTGKTALDKIRKVDDNDADAGQGDKGDSKKK